MFCLVFACISVFRKKHSLITQTAWWSLWQTDATAASDIFGTFFIMGAKHPLRLILSRCFFHMASQHVYSYRNLSIPKQFEMLPLLQVNTWCCLCECKFFFPPLNLFYFRAQICTWGGDWIQYHKYWIYKSNQKCQ